jgi:ABC-type branched-subunit amino acid transport system substrate-binding protein
MGITTTIAITIAITIPFKQTGKVKSSVIKSSAIFLVFCLIMASYPSFSQEETRKHTVTALDNYYSLSLKYDVSIEALKKANPGIANPKPGDILVIPLKGNIEEVHKDGNCVKLNKNRNEVYHVALLIPLYLEQLADTLWSKNLDPSKINELQPFRFVQFYQGFMMAADSLRQKGLKVEISVFDVDQQTAKVSAVLKKPEMKKMDLIIGPFFKNSFAQVAEFALENHIPVINPLSSRSDILEGNPYVFKLLPSLESQPDIVAKLVRRDYPDHKVLLYVANQYQNKELIERYKEAIEQSDPGGKQKVTVVDYAADSIQGFRSHASLTKPNLVIIYAENEVLPSALLSKLSAMKEDYRISVIGLPEWEKFTNIETIYLIALNANILMSSYTDTGSEEVKGFFRSYRERYYDEPLNYALTGFDAGFYFLDALMSYGKDFRKCLDEVDNRLIQNQYHFGQKVDGGYDNLNWNVLQYVDYFLLKKSFY